MSLLKLMFLILASMMQRCVIMFAGDVGVTTDSILTKEVDAYYDKTLIQPLRSAWIWGKYGQARQVKEHNIIRFSTYPSLGNQAVALVEGVNPEPQKISKTSITATVSLYGGYVELTEECDIYRQDPVVAIAQERVNWQAVETCDQIVRDVVYGGTNVLWANAQTSRAAINSKILASDLQKLARAMMVNKAPFFKTMITGGTGVGTNPIQNSWLMFISPQVLYDLENSVTGWRNVATYASQGGVEQFEAGSFGYFRMMVSTECPVYGDASYAATAGLAQTVVASHNDIHPCLAISPDAYGVVNIDGGIKTIRKDKSVIGGALELYGTAGWKARMTAKILDDNKMYRYECGVSS